MIQYSPVQITGQAVTTQISAYPDTRSIVIYNESPYFLQVSLVGSGMYGLAAYTADAFPVFSGFTGSINVNPTPYIVVESGTPPASIMFVQAYGNNEQISKLIANNSATGYPISLNRLQNIGNGAQVSGSSSSISNDNNAAGTSLVESTVSGDTSSCVKLSNDGIFSIGNATHHGSVSFDNGKFVSDGVGDVTVSSLTCLGDILLPNNSATLKWQDNTGSPQTVLFLDTNNNLQLHVESGDRFDFFNAGIVSSFTTFKYGQVSGTGATVTHGLGGTPSAVLIVPITGQPGSATCGVGNVNSTTFQATVGSGTGFYWFAIR